MTQLKKVAKLWLQKAGTDFVHAQQSLELASLDWAQLAAQQSAEKALKAVLILRGFGLIKIHDLQMLARNADAPKEIITHASTLNSFYTISRYPDVDLDMTEEQMLKATQDAIESAKAVIEWCKRQIKI
ncbi:MAG: HEPN domain-containing protein [archaeon]